MTTKTLILFGVVYLLCLLQFGAGFSILTRIPIGYDNQAGLHPSEINRYTDRDKRLTAVKDSKYVSCFIKDYDPFWNPDEVDMKEIMDTSNFQTIKTDEDERKLRKRAGRVITEMCRRDRIYWATPPPPPQLNPGAGNGLVPPPIGLPDNTNPHNAGNDQLPKEFPEVQQQQHGGNQTQVSVGGVPPPTRRVPETIKTPPPIGIYPQQHMTGRLNGPMIEPPIRENVDRELPPPIGGAFHIKTPPPLEVYQRQNMNNKPDTVPTEGQQQEKSREEKAPPTIGNAPPMRSDLPKIPPPLRQEVEVPPSIGYIPETESEVDQPRAPPPLEIWRRMLASIKQTTTLEPPPPDMRSPEFKTGK